MQRFDHAVVVRICVYLRRRTVHKSLTLAQAITEPHRIMLVPPRPLLAVPNVTAHPPITVLLYNE